MQNLQTQKLLPLDSPRKTWEIIHSRKLISLFKVISIFLTSMEEVILLGLPGTTKSSLTWSFSGNTFFFCLNKDLGGTLSYSCTIFEACRINSLRFSEA